MTQKEKERIIIEIRLYEQLDNPYILKLIKAWRNKEKDEVVMITELMTCSLKEYIHRNTERPRLKVIKTWCKSILKGLEYLHSRNPPVIHRDLKCENIFISSSSAEIRIGDLGLSTTLKNTHLKSQVGTPYFMAPEMYEEKYGAGVDIYSFGLCVIEMCTLTTPYSECTNQAVLFQKIKNGEKPEALLTIGNEVIQDFICACIQKAEFRPTVQELLGHKFLEIASEDASINSPVPIINPIGQKTLELTREILQIQTEITETNLRVSLIIKNSNGTRALVNFDFNPEEEVPEQIAEELVKHLELSQESVQVILKALEAVPERVPEKVLKKVPEISVNTVPEQRTPKFYGRGDERIMTFSIKLGIQTNQGIKKVSIEINFDLDKDTAEEVAEYTVNELGLEIEDYEKILNLVKKKISEIDSNIYSSYSCIELFDIDGGTDLVSPMIVKTHAHSNNSESIASDLKSPNSGSSKNSSFEMITHVQAHYVEPFYSAVSPITSASEAKITFSEEIKEKIGKIKGTISRKNVINNVKDVKCLQEALATIFQTKIKPNGVYTKKTERQVKIFQANNSLSTDGIVNQIVWETIMSKFYLDTYQNSHD